VCSRPARWRTSCSSNHMARRAGPRGRGGRSCFAGGIPGGFLVSGARSSRPTRGWSGRLVAGVPGTHPRRVAGWLLLSLLGASTPQRLLRSQSSSPREGARHGPERADARATARRTRGAATGDPQFCSNEGGGRSVAAANEFHTWRVDKRPRAHGVGARPRRTGRRGPGDSPPSRAGNVPGGPTCTVAMGGHTRKACETLRVAGEATGRAG